MAEGSTASPTSIPNRRSSIRRSGVSSSPPSSLSSQILPPRSRAMTAGELHNAMEQEQEVAFPATRSSISFILPILLIFLLASLNHTLSFLLFSSTFVFPLLRHILLFLSPFLKFHLFAFIRIIHCSPKHITNNLLKHIDQLRADKIRIEHELEAESEAVMNRLTRELSTLRNRLESAGLNPTVEGSSLGNQSPRSPSRSPSRASSLSRRSLSGANSPRSVSP